jgi:hypothetical protein
VWLRFYFEIKNGRNARGPKGEKRPADSIPGRSD